MPQAKRSGQVQILDLPLLLPDYRDVRVERQREDGTRYKDVLQGMVFNDGATGEKRVEISQAYSDYWAEKEMRPDDSHTANKARIIFERRAVRILVPDLTWEEADRFAGGTQANAILRHLELYEDQAEEGTNDLENPPAASDSSLTTAESSLSLTPPTTE